MKPIDKEKIEMEKSCGAVVYREINKEIQFLAIKSRQNDDWGLPKGHMEDSESEEETAKREILEETGLKVELTSGFRVKIEYILPKGTPKEVVYFIGRALGETVQIQEEEVQEYKWLSYGDTLDLLTFENVKEVVVKANVWLMQS